MGWARKRKNPVGNGSDWTTKIEDSRWKRERPDYEEEESRWKRERLLIVAPVSDGIPYIRMSESPLKSKTSSWLPLSWVQLFSFQPALN